MGEVMWGFPGRPAGLVPPRGPVFACVCVCVCVCGGCGAGGLSEGVALCGVARQRAHPHCVDAATPVRLGVRPLVCPGMCVCRDVGAPPGDPAPGCPCLPAVDMVKLSLEPSPPSLACT